MNCPLRASTKTQWGWSEEAIRAAERATGPLFENGTLMERAAHALARRVEDLLAQTRSDDGSTPHVIVLAGPGNNGGDALFAAAELAEAGITITVIQCGSRLHDGGRQRVNSVGLPLLSLGDAAVERAMVNADIVLDGILGIGVRPGSTPQWQGVVSLIPHGATVIAVDCPTPGISADITLTFGANKTRYLLNPEEWGSVELVDIGLSPEALGVPDAVLYDPCFYAETYPVPGRHDHKYTRGVVGLATGSDTYPGAAVLGAVAALSVGTGMVRYVGPERPRAAVLAAAPEAVLGEGKVQAWVVGSGIDGPAERSAQSERYNSAMKALQAPVPAVVDAGALSWLEPGLRPAGSSTIMTPHAGELAMFLGARGIDVERQEVEAEPLNWARRAAQETGFTVLLKGGVSVIADPSEPTAIVENRTPAWLATAGTGDVLAGAVGALLASGVRPHMAAALGAYLHGQAAVITNPGGPVRAPEVAKCLASAVTRLLADSGAS